ncbi:MAG: glycosyltransferase family 4 protein [Terriglobia bacterium]|nr:glycosyltransferase family 4 protein [Terriglobia bacterium]
MKRRALIIIENCSFPDDIRVWNEATSLSNNDYEVTVLCPKSEGTRGKRWDQSYEVINGIHVYRYPQHEGRGGHLREYVHALFWQFVYTFRIYLRHRFHVIQGCNPPDDIFLVALPFKLFGIPYIFDHHDACPELYLSIYRKHGIFYKLLWWLEKLSYSYSDVVMSTNNSYRELALGRGGKKPEDVFVVRNGPDLNRVTSVAPNHSLKHGKRYLVAYVGTMGVQEGVEILLDAALHLKKAGRDDIHFTCVGGGSQLERLRTLVTHNGLEGTVNFTGPIPDEDLMEILSTSDVCVNPDTPCSMNDISTMIKIIEYMALGKPIVQFDLREGRFSAGDASLYADSATGVPDFAAKIAWLLDRPDERARMGQSGRKRVELELAWKYSVEQLLAAYDRAFCKAAHKGAEELRHGWTPKPVK